MRRLRMGLMMAILALTPGLGWAESLRVHVVPEHPTTSDPLKVVVEGDTQGCSSRLSAPQVTSGEIVIVYTQSTIPENPVCSGNWASAFDLPPLAAGVYDIRVESFGVTSAEMSVVVNPPVSS